MMTSTVLLPIVGTLLRALLQVFGAQSLLSADQQSQVTGAVMVIGSVLWSIWQKVQADKKLTDAKKGF
jgi:hypothetical protein